MNKILFTSLSGIPNGNMGGAHRIILEILKKLNSSIYKTGFLSCHYSNDDCKKDDILAMINSNVKKINVIRQKLFYASKIYRTIFNNALYWNIHLLKARISFIKAKGKFSDFDLIHSHDVTSLYFLKKLPQKKILSIHSKGSLVEDLQDGFGKNKISKIQKKILENIENKSIEIADIITFPSIAAKNTYFRNKTTLFTEKVKIVYNGVDLKKIESLNDEPKILGNNLIGDDYLLLLNIAEHIKPKNIDKALFVVKNIISEFDNKVLFINIGKGPETDNLKKIVIDLGIQKNVRFYSFLPNNEVISLMKKFNFLISLSERVIFDMVILEALACGMTIIASNEGGNKEVIQNGINGYLVNPNNTDAIKKIILNSPKEIGLNAMETARKFSNDEMIRSYEQIYSELLK